MTERKELFRPEAAWHHASRGGSSSLICQHRLLTVTTWLTALILCGLVVVLCSIRYKETVTARGVLESRVNSQKLVAPGAAVVKQVNADVGQRVRQGDVLIVFSTSTFDVEGRQTQVVEINNLALAKQSLEQELELHSRRYRQSLNQSDQSAAGLEQAIRLLQREQRAFEQQLAVSEQNLTALERLLENASLSRFNFDQQHMAHLELTRQYQNVLQRKQQQTRELEDLAATKSNLGLDYQIATTRLGRQITDLESQISRLTSRDITTLVAERDGIVAAVAVEDGNAVRPGEPVMVINPPGYELQAVLFVPSRVVGKLAPGQPLLLSYDAFSHLDYGRYPATIAEISQASLDPREHLLPVSGINEPVFRVVAYPQQEYVDGVDNYRLQAGFQLSADFIESEMSLISYVFRPLRQLRGKVS